MRQLAGASIDGSPEAAASRVRLLHRTLSYSIVGGAAIAFAYQVGWRTLSEILLLRWSQVDLDAGVVRLEVGTTKNKKGRLVYLPAFLMDVLEKQWKEHVAHYPRLPLDVSQSREANLLVLQSLAPCLHGGGTLG